MATKTNYSIIADVQLDLSKIQRQLNEANLKLNIGGDSKKDIEDLSDGVDDLALSVDAAGRVFSAATQVIGAFVSEVYELDSALTEFKKVSDLQGDALDSYVDKLSEMGQSVARTGKPNRSEPVCCDGKAA